MEARLRMGYGHRKQSADREAGSSETEAASYGIDAERMTAEGLRGLRAEWQAAPPMPTDVRAHWWLTTRIRWSLHTTVIKDIRWITQAPVRYWSRVA